MTAVIHKISVGAGGKHALSPEESPRRSVSSGIDDIVRPYCIIYDFGKLRSQ